MSKVEFVLDNEGEEVRVGDEVIASINYWKGKDETHRGTVVSVSKCFCTVKVKAFNTPKRVSSTKFIRVKTAKELEVESYQGCQ